MSPSVYRWPSILQCCSAAVLDEGALSLALNHAIGTLKCQTVSVLGREGDVRSNIALCRREFSKAKPEGTPEGKRIYLSVCPESSLNTDSI